MFHQTQATELNYNNSFPFDVLRYQQVDNYTDQQIKNIIDTVWQSLPLSSKITKKNKIRTDYRDMVKNYVLNLILSYQSGYCIRVSRSNNDYHYNKRYSQINTTATIVIKTMDALADNGWIDLHIGFYNKQRNKGKQTRLYPSQKFINLIENIESIGGNKNIKVTREDVKEVIQLRHKINDKQFKLKPYKDTPKTIKMRHRLNQYNSFMRQAPLRIIILTLTRKELTGIDPEHADSFNNMMLNGSIVFLDRKMKKGSKVVVKNDSAQTTDQLINRDTNTYNVLNIQIHHQHNSTHNTTTTNTEREDRKRTTPVTKRTTLLNTLYQTDSSNIPWSNYGNDEDTYYSIDQVLNDYPRSRKFWFRINHCTMFRAFSDTSKAFNHHGRFYGDPIQNFPSWMRAKITMGNKNVVECDYTSIHPTMLYVMTGAIPPDNIYMIDKRTDPKLRKEYKTVLLISINHKNPKTMWSAVSSHFRKEFGYEKGDERLTKKYIERIYARLRDHNKPIAKFMNTGVAMRLMRKDSEIADRIMMEFINCEIPIKCIHDSFIVPAEYETELKTLMVEYFQEVMDTDYVIGVTTESAHENRSGKVVEAPVLPPVKKDIVDALQGKSEQPDEAEDNMKYFEGLFDDKEDDENFIIIPEGSRFAGIRI